MEASENPGVRFGGSGGPELHQVDLGQVRRTLRGPASERGYARLSLMLDTILPRLERGRESRS